MLEDKTLSNTESTPILGMADFSIDETTQQVIDTEKSKKLDMIDLVDVNEQYDSYLESTLFAPVDQNESSFSSYDTPMSQAYTVLNSGDAIASFERFDPEINNEERLANEQSGNEQWWNGLRKFVGKTGTAALGGTIGVVTGIVDAIQDGSWSSLYDNDFALTLDDWNTRMDKKLPNYYTEYEKNLNFWNSMGTANFWANDVSGGLSFTTGMILSEGIWAFLTGGAALATTGARLGARMAFSTAKKAAVRELVGKGMSVAKAQAKAGLRTVTKKAILKGAKYGSNTGKGINTFRFAVTSAGYEAGVESFHFLKEAKENYLYNYEQENGNAPSPQELADFANDAKNHANAVYAANIAILGISNIAMFGKRFNIKPPISSKYVTKGLNRHLFGIGSKEVTEAGKTAFKVMKPNVAQKTFGIAHGIVKPMLLEGIWEEGNQAIASGTAKNMLENSYSQENANTSYGVMEAMYDAMSHTYGTKEGFKEVGIGMLIGVLSGGMGGSFTDVRDERRKNKHNVEYYNAHGRFAFNTRLRAAFNNLTATKSEEKSNAKGDITASKISVDGAIIGAINAEYKMGNLDNSVEDFLTMIDNTSASEFEQMTGISEKEVDAQNEYKEEIKEAYKSKTASYKANMRYAEQVVGDSEILKMYKGKEVPLDSETLKDAIAHNLTMAEGMEEYSRELLDEIKKTVGQGSIGGVEDIDALEMMDVLRKSSYESKEKYIELHKKRKELETQRKELVKVTTDFARATENAADRIKVAQKAEANANALLKNTEALEKQQREEEALMRTMKMQNPFSTKTEFEAILPNSFSKVLESIDNIEAYMNDLSESNPQLYAKYQKLSSEYLKANAALEAFNSTIKGLSNPALRTEKMMQLLPRAFQDGTSFEDFSQDFFVKTALSYKNAENVADVEAAGELRNKEANAISKRKDEIENPTVESVSSRISKKEKLETSEQEFYKENKKEIKATIAKAKATKKTQQETTQTKEKALVEQLSDKYDELLEKSTLIVQNLAEEEKAVLDKPSEEEIQKYEDLVKKINKDKKIKDKNATIKYSPRYFQKKKIKTKVTPSELRKFQELHKKMVQWRLIQGTADETGVSVEEVLKSKAQLDQKATEEDVRIVNESENIEVGTVTAEDSRDASNIKSILQTTDIAKVRMSNNKKTLVFSLLNIDSFLVGLKDKATILVRSKTSKVDKVPTDKDNKTIGKEQGTVYTVKLNETDETILIKIGEKGQIRIESKDYYDKLEPILPFKVIKLGIEKSKYFDIYKKVDENGVEVLKPREADFKLETVSKDPVPVIEAEELYKLKEGDKVELKFTRNDSYNKELENKLKAAKAKLEKTKKGSKPNKKAKTELKEIQDKILNKLHIYVYSGNKIIGVIKADIAQNLNRTENQTFNEIRKEAADAFMDSIETNNVNTDLQMTLSVKKVFKGTPNLVLETVNGKQITRKFLIKQEHMSKVKGIGYLLGEKAVLNSIINDDDINMDYVSPFMKDNNKKVPIIILEHEGFLFAFPLNLKIKKLDLSRKATRIIGTDNTHSQKAIALNQLLLDNNIDVNTNGVNVIGGTSTSIFTDTNTLTERASQLLEKLKNIEVIPDISLWTEEGINQEVVMADAEIALDLDNRPLVAPKAVLDLTELERTEKDEEVTITKETNKKAKQKKKEEKGKVKPKTKTKTNEDRKDKRRVSSTKRTKTTDNGQKPILGEGKGSSEGKTIVSGDKATIKVGNSVFYSGVEFEVTKIKKGTKTVKKEDKEETVLTGKDVLTIRGIKDNKKEISVLASKVHVEVIGKPTKTVKLEKVLNKKPTEIKKVEKKVEPVAAKKKVSKPIKKAKKVEKTEQKVERHTHKGFIELMESVNFPISNKIKSDIYSAIQPFNMTYSASRYSKDVSKANYEKLTDYAIKLEDNIDPLTGLEIKLSKAKTKDTAQIEAEAHRKLNEEC